MLLSALISSQGHGGPSKADPRPAVQELKSARHRGQIWVGAVSKNRYGIIFLAASSIVNHYACRSETGPGSVAFEFSLVIALDMTVSNVIPYTLFMF